jgi:hypothetical protein
MYAGVFGRIEICPLRGSKKPLWVRSSHALGNEHAWEVNEGTGSSFVNSPKNDDTTTASARISAPKTM